MSDASAARRSRLRDQQPAENWTAADEPAAHLEQIYRTEAPRLARFFARRAPAHDRRDLVQETFRRLIGHEPDRPAAFLTRMATNLVVELRRTAARRDEALHQPFEDEALAGPDPVPRLEARDAVARIDAALLTLKPKTRDLFLLHRVEGMTYAEIGKRYGMSAKGVEKQVVKALLHVRARVGSL